MDKNELFLSGEVGWHKLKMASGRPFGTVTIKVKLPRFDFKIGDTEHVVDNPIIWLNVFVSQDAQQNFGKRDQALLDMLATGENPYITICGAKITNWIDSSGITKFNLDCSAGNIFLRATPVTILNKCIFEGTVAMYDPNGKMIVECSYLIPKEKTWNARKIPVMYTGEFNSALLRRKILLFGKACGTTPSGENKLYIVTDQVHLLN